MSTEQIIRDQLARATSEVPGGPDLEAAISGGRRRRRTVRVGLAVAAVAAVGVGAAGVGSWLNHDPVTPRTHEAQVADAPPAAPVAPPAAPVGDFVAGTGIDEALVAIVAAHLPTLPAADDVYPSDSHTAGPIPDADFAQAEDWQATYTENGNEVLVMTGLPSEGSNACLGQCDPQQVPGGTVYTQVSSSTGDDGQERWYFGAYFTRADGTFANAWEIVPADADDAATSGRHVSDAELVALVQDPGLTFAALSGA